MIMTRWWLFGRYRAAMVIGNVLYRNGQHADAEPYFREVLSLSPTHTGVFRSHLKSHRSGILFELLLRCPTTGAMNNLGAIMQPDGDDSRLAEAAELYEGALRFPAAHQDKALLSSFGALLCRPVFKRYEEAAALFSEALELDPKFEVGKTNLAWVQRKLTSG